MLGLAGHLAAATCSFLLMVGEYDERGSWATWECLSCAHWLNWRCGVGMTAAREQVRVARRLRELPLVRATFARGEISYSKVRAITGSPIRRSRRSWSTWRGGPRRRSWNVPAAALRRCADVADAEQQLQGDEERAELCRSLRWHHEPETGDLVVRLRIPAGVAAESFRAAVSHATQAGDDDASSDGAAGAGRAGVPSPRCAARPGVRRRHLRQLDGPAGRGRGARHRWAAGATGDDRVPALARRDRGRSTAVDAARWSSSSATPGCARCSSSRRRSARSCGPGPAPRRTSVATVVSRVPPSVGRSTAGTAGAVGSRGATAATGCTCTTSSGGNAAAAPIARTCSCCARSTIGRCTTAAGRSPVTADQAVFRRRRATRPVDRTTPAGAAGRARRRTTDASAWTSRSTVRAATGRVTTSTGTASSPPSCRPMIPRNRRVSRRAAGARRVGRPRAGPLRRPAPPWSRSPRSRRCSRCRRSPRP